MEKSILKNKTILFITIVFTLVISTACNSNEETSEATSSSKEQANKNVSIMLDWYPNAIHSFLYVAQENGYFNEENIDVEFQFPANPTDPLTLAASGKVT